MTWANWIFARLFDCIHQHTTWPQRGRSGVDYVCCLDCGREFRYSTRLMCIVWREDQRRDRSQQNWAELTVDRTRARTNGGLPLSRTIDAASSSRIPNWLELSLPAQVLVDPQDANAAEVTPHP